MNENEGKFYFHDIYFQEKKKTNRNKHNISNNINSNNKRLDEVIILKYF